jgi:D-alanine-D-alanine ligase
MKKLRLGIIFGGKSPEHEISLLSSREVIQAVDRNIYEVIPLFIDKEGVWHIGENNNEVAISDVLRNIDIAFPLVHGTNGEDGTLQGLLRLFSIPYVGADVAGSAIAMDKDVTKRLLRDSGIPVARFRVLRTWEKIPSFSSVVQALGLPFFIKPASLGSSIGVRKVTKMQDYKNACKLAFSYDTKIIFEEYIKGRELWCNVIGNEKPTVSLLGEIKPENDFFDYEAKYTTESKTTYFVPASIKDNVMKHMQALATKTYQTLCCEGMARVDFFLTDRSMVYVNEVNTIPGFRETSLYPKLWKISGMSYPNLINTLLTLARERYKRDQRLKFFMEQAP